MGDGGSEMRDARCGMRDARCEMRDVRCDGCFEEVLVWVGFWVGDM